MRFVFASYISFPEYTGPTDWLERIKAYSGVMEALAETDNVISIEQISYKGKVEKGGVHYHFGRFSKYGLRLNLYISSLKPDVVFIHSLHFPLQVMLLRLILGSQTRIIIQNHAEKPFKGLKRSLVKLADKYADAYLFASKAMGLDWIKQGNLASPQKIHEVMELSSYFYPLERELARQKTGIKEKKAFLWVGRLDANKDPLTVINAFLAFANHCPEACLYMIYHTDQLLPQIKALTDGHPNRNAIKLIGRIPNSDLLYWYNSVDFILSGSHYEGSGTAICEAMSCGCIPIVTDIFSFRMITDNGNIGLLYTAGNETACLHALKKIEALDLSAEKQKALAYFKSNLSFKAIAKNIVAIAANY